MDITITEEHQLGDITKIILKDRDGFQIEITPGHSGFVLSSSQVISFRRYSNLSWEVYAKPEYNPRD